MMDANIVTLYKNKGDRSDCNNYRGISLLSAVGKLFARVVLKRLQVLADRVYPESQCGFRVNRSTVEHDLLPLTVTGKVQGAAAAPLCGLHRSHLRPLIFLVEIKVGLFKILAIIGCPTALLSIIKSIHADMGTDVYGPIYTTWFK